MCHEPIIDGISIYTAVSDLYFSQHCSLDTFICGEGCKQVVHDYRNVIHESLWIAQNMYHFEEWLAVKVIDDCILLALTESGSDIWGTGHTNIKLSLQDTITQSFFENCYTPSTPSTPICPDFCVGDGVCDYACNLPECRFDHGDCECPDDCKQVKGDGYCNEECDLPTCDRDGGDCDIQTCSFIMDCNNSDDCINNCHGKTICDQVTNQCTEHCPAERAIFDGDECKACDTGSDCAGNAVCKVESSNTFTNVCVDSTFCSGIWHRCSDDRVRAHNEQHNLLSRHCFCITI